MLATLRCMSALENLVGAMTLAELARLANTSVEQVVNTVLGGRPPSRATAAPSRSAASQGESSPRRDKVPRGALRVDHVLATLASSRGPAKLDDVRAKVGGSAAQVRSALQKLAAAGKVKITGERRGTRYVAR